MSNAPTSASSAHVNTNSGGSDLRFAGSVPLGLTLTEHDLILPSALPGKQLGVDYCLLAHNTDPANLTSIFHHGLKTLAQLAAEPWTSQSITDSYERDRDATNFVRDPSLIYTRPITPSSLFRVHPSSIVFAVHPNSVKIFNSQGRSGAYGTFIGREGAREERPLKEQRCLYVACQLSYQEFTQRSAVAPRGLLNKYGSASPLIARDLGFWPEVLLRPTGPEMDWLRFAIHHDQIPEELKWVSKAQYSGALSGSPSTEQEQAEVAATAIDELQSASVLGQATVTFPFNDPATSA